MSSSSSTPYKVITTEEAPKAIGPYSQATVHNGVAYISGCIPFIPSTMTLVEGGIEAQAEQAMKNLLEVVKAAGSDKSHILKSTVFMTDMNDFAKINVS
jgi:2-iminobutanoate/2-iminopropanoate deaminase